MALATWRARRQFPVESGVSWTLAAVVETPRGWSSRARQVQDAHPENWAGSGLRSGSATRGRFIGGKRRVPRFL